MQIISDIQSFDNPKNGYVVKTPDILLLNPEIRRAQSNGLRIHGMAKNIWTVRGVFSDTVNNDNTTVHFGDTGSYDIRDIFFFDCDAFNAGEEDYDAVIGENIWYFFCRGGSAVAGHNVKKVFYVGCAFDTLKVKASEEVYLIHSTVQNLIFETQGTGGQGVGAGLGPASVYVYKSTIVNYNPNEHGAARIDITTLPETFALPTAPAEVLPHVEPYYQQFVVLETPPVTTATIEKAVLADWITRIDTANAQLEELLNQFRTLATEIQSYTT